jgi:hypothetical protein
MDYKTIRPTLQDGDLVAVNTGNRLTQWAQKTFGATKWARATHVGVLIWRGDRLHVAEMDGRYNVERPLSHYVNNRQLFSILRAHGVDQVRMACAIDRAMASAIHYDNADFGRIGWRLLTGFKMRDDAKRMVCSQFVSRIYCDAGLSLFKPDDMLTPAEVCAAMPMVIYE